MKKQIIFSPINFINKVENITTEIIKKQNKKDSKAIFDYDLHDNIVNFYIVGFYNVLEYMSLKGNGEVPITVIKKHMRYRKMVDGYTVLISHVDFMQALEDNNFLVRTYKGSSYHEKCSVFEVGSNIGTELVCKEVEYTSIKSNLSTLKKAYSSREKKYGIPQVQRQIANFKQIGLNSSLQNIVKHGTENEITIPKQLKGIKQLVDVDRQKIWVTYTTQKRFYSTITNINKEYRKFLSVGGQDLVEIDIPSSQPLFLYTLFSKSVGNTDESILIKDTLENNQFYEMLIIGMYNWNIKERSLLEQFDANLIDIDKTFFNDTLRASKTLSKKYDISYRDAVNYFLKNDLFESESAIRNYIKKAVMQILYGKPVTRKNATGNISYLNLPYTNNANTKGCNKKDAESIITGFNIIKNQRFAEIFSMTYPELFSFIKTTKKSQTKEENDKLWEAKQLISSNSIKNFTKAYKLTENSPFLFHKLQTIEAEIIQKVTSSLGKNFFVTIHDSILVCRSNEKAVKRMLEYELNHYTGLNIKL